MVRIDRPSELGRVGEPAIRTWLEARMGELFAEGLAVSFWRLDPEEAVLPACWEACWGRRPHAHETLDDLFAVVEYVEEQPTFYALVVPANHEADLILIVPKSATLDPAFRKRLAADSVRASPS
ncbi:hypothetical protein [Thiocystis violacea]|uniref:hypothetical protein n=1 Tax=Thiocystis violacea TaxID=13725 RepID=UPI001905BF9A|nr:hypothetical protein [Thiocystis violacea]MBK1719164.1 hypothetical protein [Thiocystis violacea]